MTRVDLIVCVATALASASPVAAARAATCNNDIAVRVTILSSVVDPVSGAIITPTDLRADSGGDYVNGTSNVSATIHLCDGTNDAILNVSSGKRSFTYQIPAPISGSAAQWPQWVPGTYGVHGWINVRNLLYSHQPFTTHMGTTFTGPDRSTYRLGFMPPTVDAPDLHPVSDNENIPYDSSPATVYPQAFDCNVGGTTNPSWLVVGDNLNSLGMLEVGTLYKLANSANTTDVQEGQYSMPFELRIEALSCISY